MPKTAKWSLSTVKTAPPPPRHFLKLKGDKTSPKTKENHPTYKVTYNAPRDLQLDMEDKKGGHGGSAENT